MFRIGRKIYYDNITGNVVVDTGERVGSHVTPTTIDHDVEIYKDLSDRNKDSFDVIELEFGDYSSDFNTSSGFRVNPNTKEIVFSYPDPNDPEKDPVYVKPLSESINEHMDYLVDVDFRLSMVELGL